MKASARAASRTHEGVLAVILAIIIGLGAWIDPAFVRPATQLELSSHSFELALLALFMTLIIISGGIDLSVGSAMALAAVVLGLLHELGTPIWLAALAALATGTAAGAINGLFIARVRVHPLVVTLATLAAFRGFAEGISLARPISGFPQEFLRLGAGAIADIPAPGLVFAVAALLTALTLSHTVFGRWVLAIGNSEPAARRCGVPVERVKLLLYILSGAAAGLAAVLFVARRNTAKADIGTGIELEVITAVVLGGTSIFGGRGTILGTILGVAIIHEVRELVSWHWHRDELILIVVGVILIASALFGNLARGRRP